MDRIGMINSFVKLEFVSRHTKVQASALQTFAIVFVKSLERIKYKLCKYYDISIDILCGLKSGFPKLIFINAPYSIFF